MTEANSAAADQDALQEMIAEADTGARNPVGAFPKKVLFFVPPGLDIISIMVCVSPAIYSQHPGI